MSTFIPRIARLRTALPALAMTLAASTGNRAAEVAPAPRPERRAPAPLFRDSVHDGAADATLIWNREEKCWWMLYTNRRADADDEKGVKWVHGTDIGIASTPDGGFSWTRSFRGVSRFGNGVASMYPARPRLSRCSRPWS